jgi:hypothetical protein
LQDGQLELGGEEDEFFVGGEEFEEAFADFQRSCDRVPSVQVFSFQ